MPRHYWWSVPLVLHLGSASLDAQPVRPRVFDGIPPWAQGILEDTAREAGGVGISAASVNAALVSALLDAVVRADEAAVSGLPEEFIKGDGDRRTTEAKRVHAFVGPCELIGESSAFTDSDGGENVQVRQTLVCRVREDTLGISSEGKSIDGQLLEYTESWRGTLDAEHADFLELLQELGVTIEWAVGVDAVVAHAVLVRVPRRLIRVVPRDD